ncbi:MAG: TlpA family protein disulfide reductase [Nannocystaceae bacterium]|nr:TlpA family protein disulfide reductase [bacterium]
MLRRLAPLALLAVACKPAPVDTPAVEPEHATPMASAQPDVSEPEAVAEPEAEAEPQAEVEPEPEAPPEPEAQPEPETPAPSDTKAVAALPKPLFKNVKESCGRDPGVGTKLKPFRLKNLEGKEVTQGKYRKRIMLVNFWGTWCAPCLKELPEFSRLYRRYRKHGMTLVAIATDEDAAAVKALIDKKKIKAKVLLGGEEYAGKYGAPNFPFSYVVDTSGTIIGSYHGFKEDCMGKLEADIRAAIESK